MSSKRPLRTLYVASPICALPFFCHGRRFTRKTYIAQKAEQLGKDAGERTSFHDGVLLVLSSTTSITVIRTVCLTYCYW